MFKLLFFICLFWVFGKIFTFGIRAAWGMAKLIFSVVFLPLILIGMILFGLIYIAFPLLILIGIISFLFSRT